MAERRQAPPSLTAREHWGKYALGMATETAFILGLSLVALALAFIAKAVF